MLTVAASLETCPWQRQHNAPVPSRKIRHWVMDCVGLCLPDRVYWCDGTERERTILLAISERQGDVAVVGQLKDARHRDQTAVLTTHDSSQPRDIARHLIAGAMAHSPAYAKLHKLFHACMKGRTMYVVPFVTQASPAKVGVQLTDSVDVVLGMSRLAETGDVAWKRLDAEREPALCLHSVGDQAQAEQYACYFQPEQTSLSYGSTATAAELLASCPAN